MKSPADSAECNLKFVEEREDAMLKIAKSLLVSSALLMMVSMSVGCATLPASLASFRSPLGNSVPPQTEPEIESGENKFTDEIITGEK